LHVSSVDPHQVNNPGEFRKALTAAEKYQHHLKSNACWPASSDLEDCDERILPYPIQK
jgi:hypothetical protein